MIWGIHGSAAVVVCFLLDVLVWKTLALELPTMDSQMTDLPCKTDSHSCYNCKTNTLQADDYCGDPFNASHPLLDVDECPFKHYCTKWVVRLPSGAVQTTRTCSNTMDLNLKVYLVCMKESGSDRGHLCFCEGELCNSAPPGLSAVTSWGNYVTFYLIALVAGVSLSRWFLLADVLAVGL